VTPAADTGQPLVVVVDDDRLVARTLRELLESEFDVVDVTSARAALDVVSQRDVAVLLADQRMPDMSGIDLLTEARRRQPSLVGVLITAHAEVSSAIRAINSARVLGFLTKPWDEKELFLVLRRAMEAHFALRQLLRASGATERELQLFESVSDAPVPLTAQRYGRAPIREALPAEFAELAERYRELLDLALQEHVYKVNHQVSERLRSIADRLGGMSAGPRDVIDLHVAALRERLNAAAADEGSELVDVGRMMVLEMMGHVVSYYRSITLGVRT